jgi:tRNA G10  N-methylase Trm11
MTDFCIYQGDRAEVMSLMAMSGQRYDAIVTDPPYGIGSWDWA